MCRAYFENNCKKIFGLTTSTTFYCIIEISISDFQASLKKDAAALMNQIISIMHLYIGFTVLLSGSLRDVAILKGEGSKLLELNSLHAFAFVEMRGFTEGAMDGLRFLPVGTSSLRSQHPECELVSSYCLGALKTPLQHIIGYLWTRELGWGLKREK